LALYAEPERWPNDLTNPETAMKTERKKKLTLAQRLAFCGPIKVASKADRLPWNQRMGVKIAGVAS